MQDTKPLVSVIMAVYNACATLPRSIDSVTAQTYPDKELIVIDGGSTDGSLEIVRGSERRIAYFESEPDRGIYHAFNKGLRRARGDWLYFLGADDYLWQPDVLERLAAHLRAAYPPYRIVYAQAAFVSEAGQVLDILGRPWREFKGRFLQGFMLPHQAVFHHRSLFDKHGPFDESFRMGGDYELLLRELKDTDPLFVPGIVVAGYQFGGGSSLPQNALSVLRVVRRAQKLNAIRWPGRLWFVSAARVLVRLVLWRALGEARAKRALDWGRRLLGKQPFWTRI